MKSKRILLSVLISLILVLCSGCATIQHTRKVTEGEVQDVIIVELDKTKFPSNSKYLEVSNAIHLDFIAYNRAINKWFDQFFPNGENGDFELYENVKNNILVQYKGDVSNGEFFFEITFLSSGYFYLFYGAEIEGIDKEQAYEAIMNDIGPFIINYENLKVEDFSAFSYKYSRICSDTIYNTMLNQKVISDVSSDETYLEKYSSIMGSENAESELLNNVQIIQAFGTVDDRICSNANYGTSKGEDGLYYHLWNINQLISGNSDAKIELFLKAANQATWYILALVIAVAGLVVTFILAKKVNLSEIDEALTLDVGKKNDEDE